MGDGRDVAGKVGEAVGEAVSEVVGDVVAAVRPRLRGVLHEIAFFASVVAGVLLVLVADGPRARVAVGVYVVAAALLFGTSALYHRRAWSPRRWLVMQRLDHSMIFVLIGGTYTPFALLVLRGATSAVVFFVVWGGALAGIAIRLLCRRPSRWVFVPLYLALGWVALPIVPQLVRSAGLAVFVLLLVGGLCYSAGALVYALRRPDPLPQIFGFHEVFHLLVISGAIANAVAIWLWVVPFPRT